MKLLLDTHALLWFREGDRRLSARARTAIEADDATLLVSAASIWEMAIKVSRGLLALPAPPSQYVGVLDGSGFQFLAISPHHAAGVADLPWHHRDPFDRMLAAQALAERLPLVSRDRLFRRYGLDVIW